MQWIGEKTIRKQQARKRRRIELVLALLLIVIGEIGVWQVFGWEAATAMFVMGFVCIIGAVYGCQQVDNERKCNHD